MLNKFKGAMIGGLIGDCLGATFEMKYEGMVPLNKVSSFLDSVKRIDMDKEPETEDCFEFTDDSAMARQIAKSFIDQGKVDCKHLAQCFSEEYFREPWRGYGGSVVEVFQKLRDSEYRDPFKPANEQFNGSGSYGNGAGMRAHPLGLACFNKSTKETETIAENVSKLTHSHHLGVTGGVMQTMAVLNALRGDSPKDNLKKIKEIVQEREKDIKDDTASLYKHKMELVENHLNCTEDDLPEIAFELGNDVSAVDSVPTAFFCYLKVSLDDNIRKEHKFEEILKLSIRMGGDTDTIASMACAVAGADLGLDLIPQHLITCCEKQTESIKMAEEMWNIVQNNKGDNNGGTEPPGKKTRIEENLDK